MMRWVRALIMGDMFYLMAYGLIAPIFALFLRDKIPGATLIAVGIAEATFLISLATLRPFVHLSTKSDIRGWRTQSLLWFGSVLVVISPFLLLLARDMLDVCVIQMIFGIGVAFSEPAWSRLMDNSCSLENRQGSEIQQTIGTLTAAGLVAVGGFVAQTQGMDMLLAFLGFTLLAAALIMAAIYRSLGRLVRARNI